MVCKMNQLRLMFAVALLLVQSSTSSPIQNEVLETLSAQFDSFKVQFSLLERKNTENEVKIGLLETKNANNEAKIQGQAGEINQLKAKIDAKLDSDQRLPSADHDNKMKSIYREENSIGQSSTRAIAPASCGELSLIGHSLDGLYLVRNPDTNKIETVLCDFGTTISQELIGNADVKTTSVHFYVTRRSSFSTFNAVIPFELDRLNEGGAMNLASGIFTAPVPGIYHFDFSGVKASSSTALFIQLQVNGASIGAGYSSQQASTSSIETVSLSASLRLARGDRVNVYNSGPYILYDDGNHQTHFSGWLVEEDL